MEDFSIEIVVFSQTFIIAVHYTHILNSYTAIVIDLGLDGGATAGIVIAVLIVVAVLTLLGIYVVYKYYNKSKFRYNSVI